MQQQDLKRQRGQDSLIQYLNSLEIPVTRENYLDLAYPEGIPLMTAELEESLPEELRLENQP